MSTSTNLSNSQQIFKKNFIFKLLSGLHLMMNLNDVYLRFKFSDQKTPQFHPRIQSCSSFKCFAKTTRCTSFQSNVSTERSNSSHHDATSPISSSLKMFINSSTSRDVMSLYTEKQNLLAQKIWSVVSKTHGF
jgi:hypothetical protein